LEAYCVKCKTKRVIKNPVAGFNSQSIPVTTGNCSVCETRMYRIGSTPEHEGMVAPERTKPKLDGKLVIVESPAKARTIGRYLGKDYAVKASVGHVRDLLRSQLSVDVDNNFKPKYRVPNEKKDVVKELKSIAQKSEEIYLATDPDREGEAIAWHLIEAADLKRDRSKRVVFHEITEKAIAEAFTHPRQINMDLVDAQQARRILDRLVGYSISPILWEKVRNRLTAGRVQSVALRLIVEREREIDAFIAQEYWSIEGEFQPEKIKSTYIARLVRVNDNEPELENEANVNALLHDMEGADYSILKIKRGERKRKPSPPFITSTMQQEASRKLGYTTKRTMAVAQQLYEGIDLGEGGPVGLITYMRTDSTNIAEIAQKEAREFIGKVYGNKFIPEFPPVYKTKVAGAQEAHEAIRPTSVMREPDAIKSFLSHDQYRLYQLVWKRFVASQMEAAVFDTISIDVGAQTSINTYIFRAAGSTVRFPGFLILYEEAKEDDIKPEEEASNIRIPAGLKENQKQELIRLIPEQHFTQPPPRFTEATLIQALEENGIGRPSTYAPIISTIQQRGYVLRENKRLNPTATGTLVCDLLLQHFPGVFDLGFTAQMETNLDQIAAGKKPWTKIIRIFYDDFEPLIVKARKEMPESKIEMEKIGRACPDCGHDLVARWGRYGKFISCSNFPNCRHTEAWLEKIGVNCPECNGDLVERKTRKGRIFFGCANYPTCSFTSWKRPVPAPCPNCGGTLVIANKREYTCLKCEETFLIEQIPETI